ncbi:MAG: ABC transporter ATP-binding protein [Chloroflexota bacterium]
MNVEKQQGTRAFLFKYLWPVKERVLSLLLLLFVSIGFQVTVPQLMRRFLDQAEAGVVMSVLAGTAVLYFTLTVVQKVIALFSIYLSTDLGWRATNQLRIDLTDHVFRLDMGFHKLTPAGELIERIDSDISNLAEYFSDLVVVVFANILLAGAILILLFREDWRFGVIGLAYGIALFTILRAIQERIVGYWKTVREAFTNLFSFLEERLGGLEDIKANGGDGYVMHRLLNLNKGTYNARVKAETVGQVSFMASYFLYALALVAAIWFGAQLFLRGEMTVGSIVLLITYFGLLEQPFNAIRREIETFQRALASICRIQTLFAINPKIRAQETAVLPQSPPVVGFDKVRFGYKDQGSGIGDRGLETTQQSTVNGEQSTVNKNPQAPSPQLLTPVLKDVSFELGSQRILGVLGRTGSGKTTLTRLLFRLYDVDEGVITLNGVNIQDVSLSDLRQFVGLVTQDVQLFEATIRDNLTLFRNYNPNKTPISDDQILDALRLLGLSEWVDSLENGLDTRLQAGGKGLSAGEAQLVALTRVFLRDPQLVILDEASSRLDPATEQLLEKAIDRLLENRTGIIIAHRLATVQRADNILILKNGRIQEYGERIVLAADSASEFAELLRVGIEQGSVME